MFAGIVRENIMGIEFYEVLIALVIIVIVSAVVNFILGKLIEGFADLIEGKFVFRIAFFVSVGTTMLYLINSWPYFSFGHAILVFLVSSIIGGIIGVPLQRRADEKERTRKHAKRENSKTLAESGNAEAQYQYALLLWESDEKNESNKWLQKALEQDHALAKTERQRRNEIERNRKEAERESKDRAARETARLANLPKCPFCGKPIEPSYVNEYWGTRYYHVSYSPDCNWKDDEPSNPYRPR